MQHDSLSSKLFADDTESVYAVLDGAAVPSLLQHLYSEHPEYVCLYRGDLAPDMASVAPYLVHLQINSSFTDWLISEGWGKHWGIFVTSGADLRALRQHFRALLTVYDPNAKPMLFRYYDPRVLNSFLPTCTDEELETFFGPVSCFIAESAEGEMGHQYRFDLDQLKSETFSTN